MIELSVFLLSLSSGSICELHSPSPSTGFTEPIMSLVTELFNNNEFTTSDSGQLLSYEGKPS